MQRKLGPNGLRSKATHQGFCEASPPEVRENLATKNALFIVSEMQNVFSAPLIFIDVLCAEQIKLLNYLLTCICLFGGAAIYEPIAISQLLNLPLGIFFCL